MGRIFVVLKLFRLIDWSWPVVLIPLWITLAFLVVIIIAAVIDRVNTK